jgi:hypothetical protein
MLRLDRTSIREGAKMNRENQTPATPNEELVPPVDAAPSDERDQDLQHIREALRGLRYGTVSIIIQDGVVVQIDRTEKKRVRRS